MSAFTQKTIPENDPFYDFMRPPADETPAQMTARLKREADAQRISDTIDEDIKRDRAQQRKSRKELRILLLGQGESGKSTTLKSEYSSYHCNSLALILDSRFPYAVRSRRVVCFTQK